jgi:dipeptidyl aminopeptidase/acylaminoacyl peptidase
VYAGSLDGSPSKRILASTGHAEYASGHLLYQVEDALMARPFDADTLKFEGEPVPVAASVARLGSNGRVAFSVSTNGFLIFAEGFQGSGSNRLVWMDRAGKETPLAVEASQYFNLSLSPDGKQVAMGRRVGTSSPDVWLLDLARLVPTRITVDEATDNDPVWSPDGKTLVFFSTRDGPAALYRKSASGLGQDELLLKSDARAMAPNDWSLDGKFLLYQNSGSGTVGLFVLPMAEKGKPAAVQADPIFNKFRGRFSPDGKWIAFATNESGGYEVNVRSFPGNERKIQISTGGGMQPQWRRDGHELYFLTADGMLMAVPIKSLNPFEPGTPAALFQMPPIGDNPDGAVYAAAPDGSRFLVIQRVSGAQAVPLTVVENWPAALRK